MPVVVGTGYYVARVEAAVVVYDGDEGVHVAVAELYGSDSGTGSSG